MKCLIAGILALVMLAGVEFAVCQRIDAVEIESALKSGNVQTVVEPANDAALEQFQRGLKSPNVEVSE